MPRNYARYKQVILLLVLCIIFGHLPQPESNWSRHYYGHLYEGSTQKKASRTTNDDYRTKDISSLSSHRIHSTSSQKVVILPGPHKTGTTSVQAALYQWIHGMPINATTTTGAWKHPAFSNWSFPVPSANDLTAVGITASASTAAASWKGFGLLVTRLFAGGVDPAKSDLIALYAHKIQQAWDQGKSIVIASENLDRLVKTSPDSSSKEKHLSPDDLWQRLVVNVLPKNIRKQDIVIGIQHRTPRIDQMIGLWHQLGQRQESLREYLVKPNKPGFLSASHSLDSMGLADFFVKRDYRVLLFDTGGIQDQGLDLPTTVACRALQIPCEALSSMPEAAPNIAANTGQVPLRLNQRQDQAPRKVDETVMDRIHQSLRDHDCQFETQWSTRDTRNKLTMVPAEKTFATCPKRNEASSASKPSAIIPFSSTAEQIVRIICNQYPETKHC